MTPLAASLIACAVALLFRPDPGHRLAAVLGNEATTGTWAGLSHRLIRSFGKGRRRREQRMRAIEALGALAAELKAGAPPQRALRDTGEFAWPFACGAVRFDGDVAAALRRDAEMLPILAPLAACWAVSAQQGSSLEISVSRLVDQARITEDVRVQLEAQLAGPRATARILMLLPGFGIAMGMMMGVDPLGWLLGTIPGLACLIAGCALAAFGYWWTSRIVAGVEELL